MRENESDGSELSENEQGSEEINYRNNSSLVIQMLVMQMKVIGNTNEEKLNIASDDAEIDLALDGTQ